MSSLEFRKILTEVSETAVKNALVEVGKASPIVWRADAMREHGAKLIRRLEKHGLLHKKQHYPKGNYYYDVKELNYALVSENRPRFFLNAEAAG